MAVLRSAVDPASEGFAANAAAMRELVTDLRERTARVSGVAPAVTRNPSPAIASAGSSSSGNEWTS